MIDHLIRYDSEADALADPLLAPWRVGDGWDTSRCVTTTNHGLCAWRPAEDAVTMSEDGGEIRTHLYLPYWYIMVSREDAMDADLIAASLLVTDRARALDGEPDFILATMLTQEDLNSYMLAPSPAGSNYPFGNVPG